MEDDLRELVGPSPTLKAHLSPRGTATEFYNTTLKHYFRTLDPAEVAGIQQGAAGPGWQLTGDNFLAWTPDFRPSNGLPVCRFYAAGPNSHFFTINAAECAGVKLDPGWKYEGTAFYALAPNVGGTCSTEYQPVYRAYNNGFVRNDSNHRFTTSIATYQSMIAQGWAGEGVVMCTPLATTIAQQKTEQLMGGTWVIPYRFGVDYVDNLTFTDLYVSPTDGQIYAQGVNKFGRLTLGQYSATAGFWAALATYSTSGGYPYDAYRIEVINGNVMTGCYFFLISASQSLTGCSTPFIGTR